MDEIIKICVIGIISVILALILKEKSPYFATSIVIISGVLILSISIVALNQVIEDLKFLITSVGIDISIFMPVIKVSAIAIIVKISSDICKDAGFSSVSSKIQFAGSVVSIIVVFPLFIRIIDILKEIL